MNILILVVVIQVLLSLFLAVAGYFLGYARHYNVGCQHGTRMGRNAFKVYVYASSICVSLVIALLTIQPYSDWIAALYDGKPVLDIGMICLYLLWACFIGCVYTLDKAAIDNFVMRGDRKGHIVAVGRAKRHAGHCHEMAKCGKDAIKCPAMEAACVIDLSEYETRRVVAAEDVVAQLQLRRYQPGSFTVKAIGRRIYNRATGKPNQENLLDKWIAGIAEAEEQELAQKGNNQGAIVQFPKTVETVDLSHSKG